MSPTPFRSPADPWRPIGSDQVFSPPARVGVKKGTHTGYTFDASGAMTGTRTSTGLYREGNAAELRALPGQTGLWFRMTSGTWKGYWLRASASSRSFPAADVRGGTLGTSLGTRRSGADWPIRTMVRGSADR